MYVWMADEKAASLAAAAVSAALQRRQQQRSMIGRTCTSFNIRHRAFCSLAEHNRRRRCCVASATAAAAAAAVMQPKAQSWTAYFPASCQTKL